MSESPGNRVPHLYGNHWEDSKITEMDKEFYKYRASPLYRHSSNAAHYTEKLLDILGRNDPAAEISIKEGDIEAA